MDLNQDMPDKQTQKGCQDLAMKSVETLTALTVVTFRIWPDILKLQMI